MPQAPLPIPMPTMPHTFDPLTHQGKLPSPCISLCVMTPSTGLCEGCHRTIDEIVGWSSASETAKRAIWLAIIERRGTASGAQ